MQIDLGDLAKDKEAHKRRECGGVEGGCQACISRTTLRAVRSACARASNACMRVHWLTDALIVDQVQAAEGRAPKGQEWQATEQIELAMRIATAGLARLGKGEWKLIVDECLPPNEKDPTKRRLYLYPLIRKIAPELAGGIASAIAKSVSDKWREVRFDALVRLEKSPPHYRYTNPIPLRQQDLKLRHVDGDYYEVSFSLRSMEHRGEPSGREKEYRLPIRARDEYMRETLHALVQANTKLGAAQLSEDRLRPGRWYLRIAYKRKVALSSTVKAAAINKGMVAFLAAVTESGEPYIYDGDDIFAYLQQIQARRKRYQRQVKHSARVGHGRRRVLRPIEPLRAKAERWRDTRCQTIGRRYAEWFQARGITLVYIDDFEGIRHEAPEKLEGGEWIWQRIQEWPYYKLQMALISCCEELGIKCVVRSARHISQVCPKCQARGDAITIKRRQLICSRCGFRRHWDVAAALNNLAWGEAERKGESRGPLERPERSSKKPKDDDPNGWKYETGAAKRKPNGQRKK